MCAMVKSNTCVKIIFLVTIYTIQLYDMRVEEGVHRLKDIVHILVKECQYCEGHHTVDVDVYLV